MSNFNNSRRNFLRAVTTTAVLSESSMQVFAAAAEKKKTANTNKDRTSEKPSIQKKIVKDNRPGLYDGPQSPLFKVVAIEGNKLFTELTASTISKRMADALESAPAGEGTAWGIPFHIADRIILIKDKPVSTPVKSLTTKWLVFLHTSDVMDRKLNKDGLYDTPIKGPGWLKEHVADYIIVYKDGSEVRVPIRERHQIGMFQQVWGERSVESVIHRKPSPIRAHHEQEYRSWGGSQTRVSYEHAGSKWVNWLWAWENPWPNKEIVGFRFEPIQQVPIVLSAISSGNVRSNPLRWKSREKAVMSLPDGIQIEPKLSNGGLLSQIQLDLGQVISAKPRLIYPNSEWSKTYNNKRPKVSDREILVEYAAHPEATFHIFKGKNIPVSNLVGKSGHGSMKPVLPSIQEVKIRLFEKGSSKPVAVKLHVHGQAGEYLAPVDRHRIPNNAWFEDYSVDFVHGGTHNCTYIQGETLIKLPVGKVYIEVSKGFEIRPVRKVVSITPATQEITIELEKALAWREKGWVTADTHVHFLSPSSAQLEGAGEGVNIVNLLASQWGELMTNVGDFDGKTTYGSKEAGGDGEYIVRVGTENRQHVLGHISLLGYEGDIITPLTTGGPNESALGDPAEVLLTEWAKQCIKQNGVVVLPHFPQPRLENAATIVSGNVHGVEMTSWGNLYAGIHPYSLSDWYRYLNCGYFVAAVGGTDKMSAGTAVGTIRTYAKINDNHEFTYDEWRDAIRRGHTFVTYGPLMEFTVDGKQMGSQITMSSRGGTVDVNWRVASVTVPMSRVELIVNGEIRESVAVSPEKGNGHWSFKVNNSSWLALMVRGHYKDKPEIIVAHSSPVMVRVKGSAVLAAADAVTILEQIEGALVYLDTIGTRSDDKTYKRMRLILESAHRNIHNRMHHLGYYHRHTPSTNRKDHHQA